MLYVFDLDGVVYLGTTAIPGAPGAIRELQARGDQVFYLTNNSTRSRADYAARLNRLEIPTVPEQVMTSAYATGLYLQEHGAGGQSVYVLGERGLGEEMALAGFRVLGNDATERADWVVAGLDRELDFASLNAAFQHVRKGARFVATNRDATYPMETGEIPGGGSVVAALEASAGPAEITIGKPELTTWLEILRMAGVEARDAVMVGDRPETDILGGNRVGMRTVLVLSGVAKAEDLPNLPDEQRPDYVLASIAELPQLELTH